MRIALFRAGAALAAAGLLIGACTGPSKAESQPGRPNVVLVLTDDLSMNLVQHMPNVRALAGDGTTFAQYTVTDSLCCPSRSSIFTGRYPHNTGVFTNSGDGGFGVFAKEQEKDTFATTLQAAGYRTAMMGKYLNGYQPGRDGVRPGWTEWDVAGNAYGQYNYDLNENGTVKHYGRDYLTSVLERKATDFITSSGDDPFLLEVSTFSPHGPYTPAPQDVDAFPGLKAPRGPSFDKLPADAPSWLASRPPLTEQEKTTIDRVYRKRAQSVLSIDRMLGSLRQTLEKTGVADRTLVVFSSDNGFHLGEHRLAAGKQTAFDHDVHVPLIMAGPDVRAGATVDAMVQNIDLRPTFEELGGVKPGSAVDGSSLVPLLRDGAADGWKTTGLVEHHGPGVAPDDPDKQNKASGMPPTYTALRTPDYTYVEYANGEKEYYDRRTDPDELANKASSLPAERVAELHAELIRLSTSS
ncbi:sulfatase-like hydrolase/transferase [Actinoplanes bogorensis]|uniref:Sulfatase-like hydrolase/transferase n=1 Tax=Paractinoplanes bogorensis TaxID=1610840 RepID=A0ABS5Z277_9ACTN|nr:sulfatase-like hydrolase/transferase [Actinoplanes bogorensis]MBU2669049.1 sulfatase-like hydrolase/transferase [Actinoplanes bogorensis]